MGAGLIYVVIVGMWAAYLVPMWLRRHDEAAEDHGAERGSDTARVLARRDARAVSEPHRRDRDGISGPGAVAPRRAAGLEPGESVDRAERRYRGGGRGSGIRREGTGYGGRRLVRRRRRILLALVFLTVLAGGWAAAAQLTGVARPPLEAVAVTGLAVAAYVGLLCAGTLPRVVAGRTDHGGAVRRRAGRPRAGTGEDQEVRGGANGPPAPLPAQPMPTAAPTVEPTVRSGAETVARRAVEELAHRDTRAGAAEASWEPIPLTLPTYVTKPKATRPIRPLDYRAPGTWTVPDVRGTDVRGTDVRGTDVRGTDQPADAVTGHRPVDRASREVDAPPAPRDSGSDRPPRGSRAVNE